MKHYDCDSHLTEDELLRATIDLSDLDPARQAHFDACRDCRRRTGDLAESCSRLGRTAGQMAPEPRKSFRLPADDAPFRRWHLKPALALGALGVLIFVFSLWVPRFTRLSPTPPPMVAYNFEDDDQLMAEVDALVENALPQEYQQLAALAGDRSIADLDEFMDWMVPAPEGADDGERRAASDQETPQGALAWSDATICAAEGTMA